MNTIISKEDLSKIDISCFVDELLKDTFVLLKSNSLERSSNKIHNPELTLIAQRQKEMVIVLERAIRGLFFTTADSLADKLGRDSIELVSEENIINDRFVRAICHRIGFDINVPEFTVPLASIFYHEAQQGNLFSERWRIVTNQKKAVFLEVIISKKVPLLLFDPLWTKAQVTNL